MARRLEVRGRIDRAPHRKHVSAVRPIAFNGKRAGKHNGVSRVARSPDPRGGQPAMPPPEERPPAG
jgi:hypothetical protein